MTLSFGQPSPREKRRAMGVLVERLFFVCSRPGLRCPKDGRCQASTVGLGPIRSPGKLIPPLPKGRICDNGQMGQSINQR